MQRLHPSYFGGATTRTAPEGAATGLSGKELVKAYQGMADQINSKISELRKQPGTEDQVSALYKDLTNVYKRGAEIPSGPTTVIPSEKAPGGKGLDPLQRGLQNLFTSREYRQADSVTQRNARAKAYDQYVAPYYRELQRKNPQLSVPDRDYFIDRVAPDTRQPIGETVSAGVAAMNVETLKMSRTIWNAMTWAGTHYMGQPLSWEESKKNPISEFLTKSLNIEQSYLADNYAEDTRAQVIKSVMSGIPSFVAWSLAAEAGGPLAKAAPKAYQRFALRRLNEFASGFLTGKLEEKTTEESAKQGGTAAAIGTAFWFLGRMIGLVGARGASQQVANAANKLVKGQLPARAGGPIITPPGEVIPPTGELPGLPARPQLPAAGSVQAGPSPLPPQALLRSGVEGAQKSIDYISQANYKILNEAASEVSGGKYKQFAMSPDSVRKQALERIGYIMGETVRDTASHSSDFIEANAKANIQKQAQKSPAFKQVIDVTAKATGQNPAKVVADHVAEMNSKEKAWSQIDELIKDLGPKTTLARRTEVMDRLRDVVRSSLKLQDKKLQTIFAWARRDTLPAEAQKIVGWEMKNTFGGDAKTWNAMGDKLDAHIEKLILTKKIPPTDFRGVFASTNLEGNPTKWQNMLDKETQEILNKARDLRKRFGPGAANIEEPLGGGQSPASQRIMSAIEREQGLVIGVKRLAKDTGISEAEVKSILAELQKSGRIDVHIGRQAGEATESIYGAQLKAGR